MTTCMGWTPTYDKHGRRVDSGGPNTTTWNYRCSKCGTSWTVSERRGETTISKHSPPTTEHS